MESFREILDPPKRLYAIGDIHGCNDELVVLLDHLVERERLGEDDLVVCIGDYIDRGADSRKVVETMIAFKKRYPRTALLKGNHEDMLMGFLGMGGSQGMVYQQNGGSHTLESYGVRADASGEEMLANLPAEHVSFFMSLERYLIVDKFVFVHAGLNPLRDLRSQLDNDLFWIRDEFIANIHHFEKTVVFGHTPFREIVVHHPYKIGIDTGLVFGNMLSCVELRSGQVHQVMRGGTEVKRSLISELSS